MVQEILSQIGGGKITGTVVGIIGAAIATYWAIRNTNGPRERAFMVRASVWFWVGNCLFVVVMWLVPKPYNYGILPIYIVPLLLAARYWNRRQAAIRAEESDDTAA